MKRSVNFSKLQLRSTKGDDANSDDSSGSFNSDLPNTNSPTPTDVFNTLDTIEEINYVRDDSKQPSETLLNRTLADESDFKEQKVKRKVLQLPPSVSQGHKKKRVYNKRTKRKSCQKNKLTFNTVSVHSEDTEFNTEHLEMAIALSKSVDDFENPPSCGEGSYSQSSSFLSTQEKREKVSGTLEKFGFVTNKQARSFEKLDNKKVLPFKSKFRYRTPTLILRTQEEREKIVMEKINRILEESMENDRRRSALGKVPLKKAVFCQERLQKFHHFPPQIYYINHLSLEELTDELLYTDLIPEEGREKRKRVPLDDKCIAKVSEEEKIENVECVSPDLFLDSDADDANDAFFAKMVHSDVSDKSFSEMIETEKGICLYESYVDDGKENNDGTKYAAGRSEELVKIDLTQSSDGACSDKQVECTSRNEESSKGKNLLQSSDDFSIENVPGILRRRVGDVQKPFECENPLRKEENFEMQHNDCPEARINLTRNSCGVGIDKEIKSVSGDKVFTQSSDEYSVEYIQAIFTKMHEKSNQLMEKETSYKENANFQEDFGTYSVSEERIDLTQSSGDDCGGEDKAETIPEIEESLKQGSKPIENYFENAHFNSSLSLDDFSPRNLPELNTFNENTMRISREINASFEQDLKRDSFSGGHIDLTLSSDEDSQKERLDASQLSQSSVLLDDELNYSCSTPYAKRVSTTAEEDFNSSVSDDAIFLENGEDNLDNVSETHSVEEYHISFAKDAKEKNDRAIASLSFEDSFDEYLKNKTNLISLEEKLTKQPLTYDKPAHPRISALCSSDQHNVKDSFKNKYVNTNLEKTEENSEECSSNLNKTFDNDHLIVKMDRVTPIADYENMDSPRILQELDKFGLKPLKRPRAVKMLEYIYNSTHPFVGPNSIENSEDEDAKRRKTKWNNSQTNDYPCQSIDQTSIEIIGDSLLKNERMEQLIFERKQSSKIQSCRLPLQIAWHNFVSSQPELKEKILLYEPLHLEVIHQQLKDLGFKYHIEDLLTFCDRKCITIRTNQGNGKRTRKIKDT